MKWQSRLLIASVTAVATFIAIFPFERGLNEYVSKHITDSLHFPGFFALGVLAILGRQRQKKQTTAVSATELRITSLTLLVAAGAIEIVQPYTGRDASLSDLLHSAGGALFGCFAAYSYVRNEIRPVVLSIVVGVVWTVAAALPLIQSLWVYQREEWKFPNLFSCENTRVVAASVAEPMVWQRLRKTAPKPQFGASEVCGITVSSGAKGYSGFRYLAGGRDWSNYQELILQIESSRQMEIHFRIDDEKNRSIHSDRFNKTMLLAEGPNTIRIPTTAIQASVSGRSLNLQRIAFLYLFGDEMAHPYTIRLTGARLQ